MKRIITAAIVLPILFASIWFPWLWPLFLALAVVAITLGLYEFWVLAKKGGMQPDVVVGYTAAAAMLVIFFQENLPLLLFVLPAFFIAAFVGATLRGAPFDKMLPSVGATVLGVLYVVYLGGHLVALRMGVDRFELRRSMLLFFFLVLIASDTAAYYTGRALGRHKLAPNISPGKTWEGALGGLLASLAAAAIAHFTFFPEISLRAALPLAAGMNVAGVIGDLTESALKRGAGAKDAGQILPGHGGFLDRLDSLLFNAPIAYYFFLLYFLNP